MMKVFLVGGAVRDLVMGKTPQDLDFVVVGASPEKMVEMGFTQVGADFPVFLHPVTGDEFALARTERKVGAGYNGFTCEWEGVTIEEDLSRRDLTMNAMAIQVPDWIVSNEDFGQEALTGFSRMEVMLGKVIDPFGGQEDIKNHLIRHVSDAFAEDPLRVLRIGRFLARLGTPWTVHKDTVAMVGEMAFRGQLQELTAERIWKETSRALMENHPAHFFQWCRWLEIFPEVSDLHGVAQRADHHPEIDTFVHVMMCLSESVKAGLSLEERFAVLCHDLGKRPAFDMLQGNLHGHEEMGVALVEQLCDRIKVPNDCRQLAKIVAEHHTRVHRAFDQTPKKLMKVFEVTDAFRKPERFESFLKCCEADARGRLGFENREYPQADFLRKCLEAAAAVDTKAINQKILDRRKAFEAENGHEDPRPVGPMIGEAIRVERINSIRQVAKNAPSDQEGVDCE